MATTNLISTGLLRACLFAALLVSTGAAAVSVPGGKALDTASALASAATPATAVAKPRQIAITYRTRDGHVRNAYVLLPAGYRPGQNPQIPLVISPHGRAVDGEINTRRWGKLPTIGRFAVVNPDGYGRRLPLHSWGYSGQIADLARMPQIVETALPWVHVDRTRLYAIGGSMGAQETLLLVGRYPKLLAGAVAVDGPADFALQYRNFPRLKDSPRSRAQWGPIGLGKQRLARKEIGGTPSQVPAKYAARSPISYVPTIAESGVPIQIWWSRTDQTVLDPARQSGRMFRALLAAHPRAPVDEYVGDWDHTEAMRYQTDLPKMLVGLGLLPSSFDVDLIGAVHNAAGR
jgi:pimeloyl-ACP methyl ester carboxylesterase